MRAPASATVYAECQAMQRQPDHPALGRYTEIARILTGDPEASLEQGASWLDELCRALEIPPLRDYGLRAEDIPEVIEKSARASSMLGNPIPLELGELQEVLERAL
jgi:alcohol dehydrogenase class IV